MSGLRICFRIAVGLHVMADMSVDDNRPKTYSDETWEVSFICYTAIDENIEQKSIINLQLPAFLCRPCYRGEDSRQDLNDKLQGNP